MNDNNLINLGQISQFLAGSREVEFKPASLKDRYRWIAKTLLRFDYHRLRKKAKGVVQEYILKMMGYSGSCGRTAKNRDFNI